MLNQGKKLFCAFVDFTKAFAYVVRDNFWVKLIKLGIRRNISNIIRSMYETVKSNVRFKNQLSEEFACMLAEPKYKYGQQEQVTVRNHNRSTALERSV